MGIIRNIFKSNLAKKKKKKNLFFLFSQYQAVKTFLDLFFIVRKTVYLGNHNL